MRTIILLVALIVSTAHAQQQVAERPSLAKSAIAKNSETSRVKNNQSDDEFAAANKEGKSTIDSKIAHVGGSEGTGGGDACEERFEAIRDDIQKWILGGGPKVGKLKLPPGISFQAYSSEMVAQMGSAQIMCVYSSASNPNPVKVDGIPKICRFDKSGANPTITCDATKFIGNSQSAGLNEDNQYRLVHHEYAGLAGLEPPDGAKSVYTISDQINSYLRSEVVRKLAIVAPSNNSDYFHAVLNLYNQGSTPLLQAFEMWDGVYYFYQPDVTGKLQLTSGTPGSWMTFADINMGELGWQYRGCYYNQYSNDWNTFLNWAKSEISNGSEYSVLYDEDGSIVYDSGYFKFYIRRTQKGDIVMLNYPDENGRCFLSYRNVPVDGICSVFYLNKRVQ